MREAVTIQTLILNAAEKQNTFYYILHKSHSEIVKKTDDRVSL